MKIGDLIRMARHRRKLSQDQLADLVGVSRSAVTNWETHRDDPRGWRLVKIAEVLELPVAALDVSHTIDIELHNADSTVIDVPHLPWGLILTQGSSVPLASEETLTIPLLDGSPLPHAWTRVPDDSMAGEFEPGDIVYFTWSTAETIRDRDFVIATVGGHTVLRRAHERGARSNGDVMFDLRATNPDYPTHTVTLGQILALVVRHERRLR